MAVVAYVEYARSRNRWTWKAIADHGRIPLGSACGQEFVHRRRRRIVQRAEGRFEHPLSPLQRVEHRKDRQNGVLRTPRFGSRTEYEVLDWCGRERSHTSVHAFRIRFEN